MDDPDPIRRGAPEAGRHRLIPFSEEIARELGPGDDDRDAQRAAARTSVARRRTRIAVVVLVAAAVAAGAALAWGPAADRFGLPTGTPPGIPAALLAGSLLTAGLLGLRARRLGKVVEHADATIGVPMPSAHIDASMEGIIALRVAIDQIPDLPEPLQSRLHAEIGGATTYRYFVKLIAAARRVREAWASGDERRWSSQSARFVDLCEEIEAFCDRVQALLRDLSGEGPTRR
ncbi:hypothetical protein ACFOVU_15660 [Nocardiopsis sediminis]|uniref:Uncharacterized protein n=1 Tax=Nocardiopsis sediminis TaxID=1778267 RepID=A0ABV8FNE6_9ACTN